MTSSLPTRSVSSQGVSRRAFLSMTSGAAVTAAIGGESCTGAEPQAAGPPQLTQLSATRLAEMIRKKEVKPSEVVEAHLDRIEHVNPALNAVVYLRSESAVAEARKADESIAKGQVDWDAKPLFGVPVTIKDVFETRGTPTASGTLGLRKNVPPCDATAVARLRKAGAIILGKTNVPELGLWIETNNLVYGRTNNPYDLNRTPGGSSGGEAAIIAAAGSPLGLGSDGGGSIRLPSSFCGIAGLKPTWGRVPNTGAIGGANYVQKSFLVSGPLARHVEDLALALKIIAGSDTRDPCTFPVQVPDEHEYRKVDLTKLRIAYYLDDPLAPTSPDVQKAVKDAAGQLRKSGANVAHVVPPGIGKEETLVNGKALYDMDYELCLRKKLKELGTCKLHPVTQDALDIRKPVNAKQRVEAFAWWNRFRTHIREFLTHQFDAIVCPVYTEAAPKHGGSRGKPANLVHAAYYSIAQTPAVVVRCGTTATGLPVGVQIVANHWREDIALAVASHLEEALGGWQPPPEKHFLQQRN